MVFQVIVVVDTDLSPAQLTDEIVAHLDSLTESHTSVQVLEVLADGAPVATEKEKV